MHITDSRNPQVHFGGFSSSDVRGVVLKMVFIKNYDNFEEFQNRLGIFWCLLYAHHVKKIALNTSCFWGISTGSNIFPVAQFHEIFVTKIMNKLIY